MIELALPSNTWNAVVAAIQDPIVERCAILLARQVQRPSNGVKLLVDRVIVPDRADYSSQSPSAAELRPNFVASVTDQARKASAALVFVHSHVGDGRPMFSLTDDRGEKALASFLSYRLPDKLHTSIVLSNGQARCRLLGSDEPISVVVLGDNRQVLFDAAPGPQPSRQLYDRQIRAFGADGQRTLGKLAVGVVGLGGMGSLVAQQLIHLGVKSFVLLDPDVIDSTNLNRISNATLADIGRPKVEVAARYAVDFTADAHVSTIQGDVIMASNGRRLLDCDIVFGCTDSHGSRAVLEQISYQYLIPTIDMGNVITVEAGRIIHIVGRVQMMSPGLACLTCCGLLNSDEVRRDMLTAFERKADPYIQGRPEPAPAVMSLNATISSLAVTMALSAVVGMPIDGRHIIYRALSSSLKRVASTPTADCVNCSNSGRLARGDSWPFPGRLD